MTQMKYRKDKSVLPISEETLRKGRAFVDALLVDGHGYNSMKVHFGYLIAKKAVEGKNLRTQMRRAASSVQMNRNHLRNLLLLKPAGQEPHIQVPMMEIVYK